MQNVLTFKVPASLAEQLTQVSEQLGTTKGAILRKALEAYLKDSESLMRERIEEVTHQMLRGKKTQIKKKFDWDEIRRKCQAPEGMDPLEELNRFRRRGL
ncbi:MAG TPA: hypothetical protein DDW49_10605 [Deltaproteobacteria bacterium]|nr:hypothetical protein [Deltaproteobacteria bacterium]